MNKLDYDGLLRGQFFNYCEDVPVLIDGFRKGISEHRFIPDAELKKFNRIIITGSGDCWAAAQILQAAFQSYLGEGGCICQAYPPLEVSRFLDLKTNADETLIIVLSVWGFPSRLVEIMERAAHYKVATIAVTEKENSPVGKAAGYALNVHNSRTALDCKAGSCTYLGMLVSASLFAAYISEVKGIRPHGTVDQLADCLQTYAQNLKSRLELMDDAVFSVAQSWKDQVQGVMGIGDDTDMASALFFPAKMIESSGTFGGFTDSGEWLKSQNYIKKAGNTGVIIYIQKASPTRERLEEAVKVSAKRGFPTMVVSDYACTAADGLPGVHNIVFPEFPDGQTWIGSCFNHMPADLLASYLCEFWEGSYFRAATIEDTEFGINHSEGSSLWAQPGINTLQTSKHILI